MTHDIIVIGAGPAGASAARAAADAGFDVLVLDRKTSVGVPVQCGEAVGKSKKELGMIDVPKESIVQ